MRVIEPHQLKRRSIKKRRLPKKRLLFVFVVITAAFFIWQQISPKKIENSNQEQNTSFSGNEVAKTTTEQVKKNQLKIFSNAQFVSFYSTFAYPNTTEITSPPKITGLAEADKRIQKMAEARGYRLRSAPVAPPIGATGGFLVQQKAQQPLIDLFATAKKAGLTLTLTAAFRSIDEQRELFLERLEPSPSDVASGKADLQVNETLKTTAPPGYSRHHNGFTIDIACGQIGGLAFLQTDCFDWLSKDNFMQAKEFGWIPSYPDGINSVGPEPEPWEYVWVSREALLE